jgi:predicted nucleic acid-binding protein
MTFIDTAALFAVRDRDDADHLAAQETWARLFASDRELVTTSYVILETCALMQRRLGVESVRLLHEKIYPRLRVEWVDARVHEIAVTVLLSVGRRHLSLVDCVSFQVMRRLGINEVFTFDDHFREQGFDVIPAAPIS